MHNYIFHPENGVINLQYGDKFPLYQKMEVNVMKLMAFLTVQIHAKNLNKVIILITGMKISLKKQSYSKLDT